jgi:hypothetical protein
MNEPGMTVNTSVGAFMAISPLSLAGFGETHQDAESR